MTYVLIIIWITQSGLQVDTQDFNTKDACVSAVSSIKEVMLETPSIFACVEKGEK